MRRRNPHAAGGAKAGAHRRRQYVAAVTAAVALALAAGAIVLSRTGGESGGLEVYVPDLHSRTGATVKATVTTPDAARLRTTLWGRRLGELTVSEVDAPTSPRSTIASVDLSRLEKGSYRLTVQALDSGGRVLASQSTAFKRQVSGSPAVSFDEHNSMIRDGKPFFPVGIWMPHLQTTRDTSVPELSARGIVNTTVVQGRRGLGEHDDKAFADLLGQCEAAGTAGIGPARGGDHEIDVDSIVQRGKDSPALLAWMWIDEPEYNGVSPEQVRTWTEQAHAADPNHPVLVNLVGAQFVEQGGSSGSAKKFTSDFVGAGLPLPADWISTDYYPIAFAESFDTPLQTALDNFAAQLTLAREWTLGLYPTAAFIETASQPGLGSTTVPLPEQVWAETWIAVARGVKGVIWFPYDGAVHPRTASVQARATSYLTRFAPILAEPDHALTGRDHLVGSRVDFISKEHEGLVYIFAVNRDVDSPARARFTVHGMRLTNVEVYGEGRRLEPEDDSFDDNFEPYGVHIYVVTPAPPGDLAP